MRTKIILSEMPIKKLEVGTLYEPGQYVPQTPQYFDELDKKILRSPKALEKMKRVWLRSEVPLNLKFTEAGYAARNVTQSGKIPKETFGDNYDPTAINFVIYGNWGGGKVPLSGWIIAHKLGHSLLDFKYTIEKEQLFRYGDEFIQYLFWSRLGFKSARIIANVTRQIPNTIGSPEEMFNEAFSQYVLSGRINYEPIDFKELTTLKNNSLCKFAISGIADNDENLLIELLNENFTEAAKSLEKMYNRILLESVGECYAD